MLNMRKMIVAGAAALLLCGEVFAGFKEDLDAAKRGNVRAQYDVGESYAWGKGVKQDHAEAVKWFRKAAEQGYAPA